LMRHHPAYADEEKHHLLCCTGNLTKAITSRGGKIRNVYIEEPSHIQDADLQLIYDLVARDDNPHTFILIGE